MTITLTPETTKLVEDRLKLGGYADADAVVRFALQTLGEVEGEAFEDLDVAAQAAIREAEEESARGEGRPWADVREELLARLRK
jgi:Arc/MetJ-type ribon-helix-helix transcriptional regulator